MAKINPGLALAVGLGGAMVLTAAGMQLFTSGAPALQPETEITAPAAGDLRPGLPANERVKIDVVEAAPPVRIQPGPRMEVMAAVENGFGGVTRRSRQTLALNSALPPVEAPLIGADHADSGAIVDQSPFVAADPRPDETVRSARVSRYSAVVVAVGDRCGGLRSRADRLVCREPRLAEADVRMRAALDHAAEGPLREAVLSDQSRWLAARERAALDGPGAVDHMYAIRLRELEGR